MRIAVFHLLCMLLWMELVLAEWVEIPQSAQNSYLVTPYNPYVYTPSLVFTSTTTAGYEAVQPLSKPKFIPAELRKYATNVAYKKQTFLASATPVAVDITSHSPPLAEQQFQVTDDEQKADEKDFVIEEEYEQVYDDDEDHYEDEEEDAVDDDDDDDDEEGEFEDTDNPDDPDDEYYDDDEYEDDVPGNKSKDNAPPPRPNANGFNYAALLPYLQRIQNTLTQSTQTSTVKGKLSFLADIKDRLLHAIRSRINSIWAPQHARKARSTRKDMWDSWEDHSEHGMAFPSNEGALLTLGFLTFAVFLIKCCIKLIHAVKGKGHHNYHNNAQIIIQNGTGMPTVPQVLRLKRGLDNLEMANLMANVESYKPN